MAQRGFTAQEIAFFTGSKYSKSFSGQARTNKTTGTNIAPLTTATENPIAQRNI